MATNKIDRSLNLQSNMLQNFQQASRAETRDGGETARAAASGSTAADALRSGEKLEISESARKLSRMGQLLDAGKQALAAEPDIRQDRVAEARQKISEGAYDEPAAKRQLAENLAATLDKIGNFIG